MFQASRKHLDDDGGPRGKSKARRAFLSSSRMLRTSLRPIALIILIVVVLYKYHPLDYVRALRPVSMCTR